MELHLIGSIDILAWLDTAYTILKVAIGLGLVIFVHELGHFLVAKACGVKCEKFYLGFDINGWKIAKFQWGETEYGIGILPLGGYVKMLGQDDNPTRAAEERERAKLQEPHAAAVKHPGDLPHEPTAEDSPAYDPRSYMAKSVPQRMAIISAGVIMNLIFAVIFAAVAYRFGVRYIPAIIGDASPGDPAWKQGIRPGDQVVGFDDSPPDDRLRFDKDLMSHVIFTGVGKDLELEIRPHGGGEIKKVTVQPTDAHKSTFENPIIGVGFPFSTTLSLEHPAIPASPAAKAKPAFEGGDKISFLRKSGDKNSRKQPIGDFYTLQKTLAIRRDEPLDVYVTRIDEKNPLATPSEVEIVVQPNPMHHLGVVMTLGPITGVQNGSPAAEAGFKVGDQIVAVEGQRDIDPLRLPDQLRKRAQRETIFEVRRRQSTDNHDETLTLKVTPHLPIIYQSHRIENSPWSSDELGIAYSVLNRVASVESGSPADGNIQAGDEIISGSFPAANDDEKKDLKEAGYPAPDKPIVFDAEHLNWPRLQTIIQQGKVGVKVELKIKRDGKQQTVTLPTVAAADWFNPDRGLNLPLLHDIRQSDSWGEAFNLGLREARESVWQVTTVLRKLVSGDLSPTQLGGPGTIAAVAAASASEGITQLLVFLTLLSANLAVINFLPIPILDGGHMMFLLYEGIRGKPASERAMTMLTYLGLILILTLMIFVLGLDVTRLFKWIFG